MIVEIDSHRELDPWGSARRRLRLKELREKVLYKREYLSSNRCESESRAVMVIFQDH